MAKKKPTHKKILHSPNSHLLAAVLLFCLSAFLARDGAISTIEKEIFSHIYGWPDFLTPIFLVITQAGNIYLLLILSLFGLSRTYYRMVLRLLLTSVLAYLLAGLAKDLVGRARPLELLDDVIYRDFFVRGPGFPSGHVAIATALALTAGHYMPAKYRWTVPATIIGVALSRIFLGVHAPLDTLGGFAIGWGSYALFTQIQLGDIHKRLRNR